MHDAVAFGNRRVERIDVFFVRHGGKGLIDIYVLRQRKLHDGGIRLSCELVSGPHDFLCRRSFGQAHAHHFDAKPRSGFYFHSHKRFDDRVLAHYDDAEYYPLPGCLELWAEFRVDILRDSFARDDHATPANFFNSAMPSSSLMDGSHPSSSFALRLSARVS